MIESLIAIMIALVVFCAVFFVAFWVVGKMELERPFRQIVLAFVGIIMLLILLGYFNHYGFPGGHGSWNW